ncbi:MAG: CpsD/CapB family tyrosine-protein kinase [Clostridia bacterium]|nr:CpsD/CapB family tyrosine-protein kinase [Clostridia bacterium]
MNETTVNQMNMSDAAYTEWHDPAQDSRSGRRRTQLQASMKGGEGMKTATIRQMKALDYAGAEAMNTICTNLAFAGRNLKKVIFTSNTQSEGKSWMAMHVLANLAQRGRRVVLVDVDLRRSFLLQRYKIEVTGEVMGLAHYLTGQCKLGDIIYKTNMYGACIVPAGRDVTNPVSLLDSPYFAQLLELLSEQFDMVIVDAPPIGMVVDAAEIAANCDGTVLVIDYNKTRIREIRECKRQMEQSGTPVLGCIINKVSFESLSAKKYYNKSYYSHYRSGYYREDEAGSAKA